MRRGEAHHPGRLLRGTTSGLVLLVLLLAVTAHAFDLGPRWFGLGPSPVDEPAEVAPPPGLELPPAPDPEPVAGPADRLDADPSAVRRTVQRFVRDRRLGRRVAVAVADLGDGSSLYRYGERRMVPASTLKLVTAAAALHALGPHHRFRTTVVSAPGSRRVTLVGGGDPLLAWRPPGDDAVYPPRADLATLARATARALRAAGTTRVRLGFDDSLFTGPPASPDWEPSYVPDNVVTPVSALWAGEGIGPGDWRRSGEPARSAAEAFARGLRRHEVTVVGPVGRRPADPVAVELAVVESAPLSQVVEQVLAVSDNEGAEVLARHAALAAGLPGSFAGVREALPAALRALGVPTGGARILDGSGLARRNQLAPETLTALLGVAARADRPDLRPVLTGLPVAGFSGSLTSRFDTGAPAGLGSVRAKTGTLTGVHGLAGTLTTADGAVLVLVAQADRVRLVHTLAARGVLDRLAAALAACRCAA